MPSIACQSSKGESADLTNALGDRFQCRAVQVFYAVLLTSGKIITILRAFDEGESSEEYLYEV